MRVKAPRGAKDILYGQPPYGWKLAKDRSRLVKNPDEQRVIATIRRCYAVERLTMRAIVEKLRAMGVKNRRGSPFPLSRVHEIIHGNTKSPPEAKR